MTLLPHQEAWKGKPDEDSDRRCKRIKRDGSQCGKWAMVGADFCRTHGGRRQLGIVNSGPRLKGVSVFMSRVLGPTLREKFEELAAQPAKDTFSLRQELALMRIAALDAVKLYSVTAEGGEKTEKLLPLAGATMCSALTAVADMCERAARVEKLNDDAHISIGDIDVIVTQILRIAQECFDDDPRVVRFQQMIKSHVKIPKLTSEGTTITPDQDVLDMDATVPACEVPDEAFPDDDDDDLGSDGDVGDAR